MKFVVAVICLLLLGCTASPRTNTSSLVNSSGSSDVSNLSVLAPGAGAQVSSPFALNATASQCSSQLVVSMGYSLDDSVDTTIVKSTSVTTQVTAAPGAHVLHVRSWSGQGSTCKTDVPITVMAPETTGAPPNAIAVNGIQKQDYSWQGIADQATGGGGASGTMSMVLSPTLSGYTRKFVTDYQNSSGVRYWTSFGKDSTAKNFLYDVQLYLDSSSSDIANIEMDMNQVMANGETAIFGVQCDGYTNTWDYTTNAGTPENPVDQWLHSNVPCNPRSWTTNAWHHIQIAYARDDEGNVTYQYVVFDGVQKDLNATVPSAFALGWESTLLTNFQVDGLGGYGSATVYMDELTVYRW